MKAIRDRGVISGIRLEEPLPDLPILTHCGEGLCSNDHSIPDHRHKVFELTYLLRNELFMQVGGKAVLQKPGEMFIAYPDETHCSIDQLNSQGYHKIYAGIDLEAMGEDGMALSRQLRHGSHRIISKAQDVEPVFLALIRQVMKKDPKCEKVVSSLLQTIVALLWQRLEMESTVGNRDRCPHSYPIHKVIQLMRENLDKRISLRELAHLAGYSVTQFCWRFRKEVGCSPQAYHMQLRLESARSRLLHPDAQIAQVALEHNFSSSQHFSVAFRRTFAAAPGRWRKSNAGC
jgi:AraC-like DNA-binding protein